MRKLGAAVASAMCALALVLGACGGTAGTVDTASDEAIEEKAEAAVQDSDAEAKAAEEAEAAAQADAEAQAAAQALEEEHAQLRLAAEEQGLTVFVGTVRVMGGLDLCAYEDVDPHMNDNAEVIEQSTYVILELDETTHIVGMGADGSPREGDADHIGIGRSIPAHDFIEDTSSTWADYDGQRICVAGEPWFQTDVSLPFAPRMYDAQLLYVE